MSLGLNDLNKRKILSKNETKSPKAPYPAGAWSARSITARPWTSVDLGKSANRKRAIDLDAVMNHEWANLIFAPLFWIDPSENSKLDRIQNQLLQLEEIVENHLISPLGHLQNFLGYRGRLLPRKRSKHTPDSVK